VGLVRLVGGSVGCLLPPPVFWGSGIWEREPRGVESRGTCSPREFLLSDVSGDTRDWHHFGMEWKEHVAWISPILATVVAFIVVYYGTNLIRHARVRRTAISLFIAAFAFAAVAGAFGAIITKVAPVK
jgi:hypothetical protein